MFSIKSQNKHPIQIFHIFTIMFEKLLIKWTIDILAETYVYNIKVDIFQRISILLKTSVFYIFEQCVHVTAVLSAFLFIIPKYPLQIYATWAK